MATRYTTTKKPASTTLTGTLPNGERASFVDEAAAKGYGATLDAPAPAPTRYDPPKTALPKTSSPISEPTLALVDENAIRETTRKRMQSSIDAIDAQFARLITQENVAGENRAGQTRSMNARAGLIGSDFGAAHAEKTTQFNKQQVQALEDERTVKVQSVLQGIEDRASEEIVRRKAEALGQYERDSSKFKQVQESARNDLTTLARSGVDLTTLSPAQKTALFKQAGYEDEAFGELIYNTMKPKAAQIDYKFANMGNGRALFYGVDPTTGELKQQILETSNPQADLVLGIIAKYPDAGITIDDDLATASHKIQNSRIYKDQVRGPVSTGGGPGYIGTGNPIVDSWAALIKSGQATISSVPENLKNAVAGALNQGGGAADPKTVDKLSNIIEIAQSMSSDPNLGRAVGTISSLIPTVRGGTADFERKYEQLRGLLTLDNIGVLKGVLSDADMKIIKEASTKLNLKMSESGFKTELQNIIDKTSAALQKLQSGGAPAAGGSDPLGIL